MKLESQLQVSTASGVAPFTVNQATLVSNLNAQYLNGQLGGYYQNAGNLNAGTLLAARLPAFTGDVTSTVGTVGLALAASGATAGTYNNVTVNPKGLVTGGSNASYLTSNQSISITGDATGSGSTGIVLTLANVLATPGTYTKVTANAKGLITAGTSLTSADLPTYTGTITSGQVTTGLGFTPAYGTDAYQSKSLDTVSTPGLYQYDGAFGGTKPPDNQPNYRTIEIGSGSRWTQVAFPYASDGFYFRRKTDAAYSSWRTVLHDGNYNSYSPTLGGTGATGNWPISITGNASGSSGSCTGNAATATGQQSGVHFTLNTGGAGYGLVGQYNADLHQGLFAMGSAYTLGAGGTLANFYGVSWSYDNTGRQLNTGYGLEHCMAISNAGVVRTVIGIGIWTNGLIRANGAISSGGTITAAAFSGPLTGNVTGNVTGSAGSVAWTNVSGRPTAVSSFSNDSGYITSGSSISGSSRRIEFVDGPRNLSDRLPTTLARSVNWDFVGAATGNGAGNYAGVMTFTPWDGTSTSTGDSSYQLAFANQSGVNASGPAQLSIRNGINSTWNAWQVLLTSSNYTSYPDATKLPLSGGTLTGALNGTTAAFSGTITQGGNQVLHAGNVATYAFAKSGAWAADLVSSYGYTRETGMQMSGGSEFVVLSKSGQGYLLVDGSYIAAEAGGFYSTNNSSGGTLLGFTADTTTSLNFNTTAVKLNGNQVLHAGNFSAYALPYTGGTLTGNLIAPKIGVGGLNTSFDFYNNGTSYFNGVTTFDDQVNVSNGYSVMFGSSRLHSTDTSFFLGGNVGIGTGSPIGLLEVRGANRLISNDGLLQVNSNNNAGIDLGGSISFGGVYASANVTEWAQVSGRKETATSGEYGGYLDLATRPHGGLNISRIRITSIGNVGIGITTPAYKLDVNGTGRFSDTLQATRINFGADNAQPWTVGAGGTAGAGLTFGGDYTSSQAYKIFTAMEDVGGNYSKLTLNWHTGIRIGAYYAYGGTRFYNNLVGEGTEIFSVGNGDSNVRVVNTLYIGGNTALHAGNFATYALPLNPDGDGVCVAYSDENPTFNGVGVGGGWYFGADGSTTGGGLTAKILNAFGGGVNSTNGYYVGNNNFLANSSTTTTTLCIDGSNNHFANELTISGVGMGAYNLMKYSGLRSGDWQTFTNTEGQLNVIQVNNITSGAHTNYPTGVYGYGAVMSWRTTNHSFQLYASHTGDLAYKTQWQNDNYSGWRRILDSTNYPYAAAMNQNVGTGNSPSFTGLSVINTITGAVSGSSGSCTGNAASATGQQSGVHFTLNTGGAGYGLVGQYNADLHQGLFAMGSAYTLGAGGTLANFYGVSWSYDNTGRQLNTGYGLEHCMAISNAGVVRTVIGIGIWTNGLIRANGAISSGGTITAAAFSGPLTGNVTGNVTGSAGSVAWTNVSGRPTAVSSFSNDSGYITSGGSISGSSGSCTGNAASVTDGVYLSTNQSIGGVKTFSSAPVATNIAKAWVHYNKSTTTITASYNVSSVTSNGTGVFTVNFTNAMVDTNYVVAGTATYGYDDQDIYGMALIVPRRSTAQQAGSCRLATEFLHAAQIYDCVAVRAVFYR